MQIYTGYEMKELLDKIDSLDKKLDLIVEKINKTNSAWGENKWDLENNIFSSYSIIMRAIGHIKNKIDYPLCDKCIKREVIEELKKSGAV